MRWTSHIFLLTALTLGFTPLAAAKEMSLDDLRAVQAKVKSADSLTIDFVQTKAGGLRGKKTVREGRAMFAKPNLFKWMLETPSKDYWIFNGKELYNYLPDSNSAARFSPTGPKTHELSQIVDLVLNFDTLLKRYDLVKAESDGDLVKIDLKPKIESDIVGVELHLSQKDSVLTMMKLVMKSDVTLTHEFKNPVRKAIPEDSFELAKTVKIRDSN